MVQALQGVHVKAPGFQVSLARRLTWCAGGQAGELDGVLGAATTPLVAAGAPSVGPGPLLVAGPAGIVLQREARSAGLQSCSSGTRSWARSPACRRHCTAALTKQVVFSAPGTVPLSTWQRTPGRLCCPLSQASAPRNAGSRWPGMGRG